MSKIRSSLNSKILKIIVNSTIDVAYSFGIVLNQHSC